MLSAEYTQGHGNPLKNCLLYPPFTPLLTLTRETLNSEASSRWCEVKLDVVGVVWWATTQPFFWIFGEMFWISR